MAGVKYRDIDFASLDYGDVISSAEALQDVEYIDFPQNVLSGEHQIIVL